MRVVIATDEKGLKLLKAVGVKFEELWREEGGPLGVLIPPVGGIPSKKKRLMKYGRGGFLKSTGKCPDVADMTSAARAARVVQGHLVENKLSQVYRPDMGKLVQKKLGVVNGHGPITHAVDAGWLEVVK